VGQLLKPGSNAALRVCSAIDDPDDRYFDYVSAPLRGDFGVCQVVEQRLYKREDGWFSSPASGQTYYGGPTVYMMLAEGDCPRQDDKRYLVTNEVSEGIFAALVGFWKELSSANEQDVLFAKIDPVLRSDTDFQDFENAIRQGAKFKLVNIMLDSAYAHRPRHYALMLEGTPKNRMLHVDVTGKGVGVLGISTFVY